MIIMNWTDATKFIVLLVVSVTSISLGAQSNYTFEPSTEHPFGLPNPEASEQIIDWAPLIGESTCSSISRNADQSWAEPVEMTWRFKYIMNGKAVQDETLKADGRHSGSIRQFIPDSNQWYVHYYSSAGPTPVLSAWEGNRNEDGKIILYRDQKAPNGMEGFYKITFYDMTGEGFKWLGEWVTKDESFSFPTWKIDCQKKGVKDQQAIEAKILENARAFSQAYMDADYKAMANAYTVDGKIFPGGSQIIEGRKLIEERWTIRNGAKILKHVIHPEEVRIIGDYAYDYGYYEGQTQMSSGDISDWKGKYVIVWKKEAADWKMYLDIWNSVTK